MDALLFVYGTLRSGAAAHELLAGAAAAGPAETAPGYTLVDLGDYPGLVRAGAGRVRGELYAVPASRLGRLDAYEGAPRLFRRGPVALADGRQAMAYFLRARHAAGRPRIPSGDWLAHLRARGLSPGGRAT